MRSVRLSSILFLVAAMSATAACGGDDSEGDDDSAGDDSAADASAGDDSSGDDSSGDDSTTPDGPSACTMAAVGTVATEDGTTATYTADEYYGLGVYVNSDATPDALYIELYNTYTVFADGFAPVTVDLTDTAEQDYATCGACVVAYTDVTSDGSDFADNYMPSAGTLDITEVSTTALTGTLTGATFRHVEIDSTTYETTDAADGCTATVESFSFDAIPEEASSFARTGGQRWRVTAIRPMPRVP